MSNLMRNQKEFILCGNKNTPKPHLNMIMKKFGGSIIQVQPSRPYCAAFGSFECINPLFVECAYTYYLIDCKKRPVGLKFMGCQWTIENIAELHRERQRERKIKRAWKTERTREKRVIGKRHRGRTGSGRRNLVAGTKTEKWIDSDQDCKNPTHKSCTFLIKITK